jgi:O-antigen/teichoic acid export membrane protein
VPNGLATMLETLALGIDKVLVSTMCPPEEFAVFVNGAMEIPFIGIISGAATAVILPDIVAFFKKQRKDEALGLWQRSARKVSLLILPLGGLLFVVGPELMTLLYSTDYLESSRPFRIYLLLLPARVVFFGAIFQAAGRPDLILKRAIGTLVLIVVVSYPMIRHFGMEGAAWGTVVVFWLYVIPFCIRYCSRLLDIRWVALMPYRYIGLILLAIAVAGLTALQLHRWFSFADPLWSGALTAAAYLAILMTILSFLCREELNAQWTALRSKIAKLRGRT